MIPTYLRDEIVLRLSAPHLHRRKLKAICRLLEIEVDAALNPSPSVNEVVDQLSWNEALPFSGSVPFDFETRSGNYVRRVPGRIVYVSDGLNDVGEIGTTISTCQTLVWDPGEPAPEWQPMPENVLPDTLVHRLSEAVLDAVIEEQRQKTASIGSET